MVPKNNISVHFIAGTLDDGIALLKSGKVDVHAGMAVDMSNDMNLSQGAAIYESNAIIFTDKDIEYSGSFEELNAYQVGVIQNESTGEYLKNYLQNTAPVSFSGYSQLMDAVVEGRIKVFAADALTTFFHLNQKGILNSFYYNRSESLFATEWRPTVLATNKDVQNLVSSGMDLVSDTARQKILRRWSSGIPHIVADAIIIATPIKYPPLSVIGSDGKARGYLIDFWQEWGRQVNMEVQFRGSVWNETLRGVKSGEADIHSGLFKNEERKTWLTFSHPFFVTETALFYKNDSDKLPSLDKLAGKPIGAIQGSFQENFLRKEYPSIKVIGYSDLDRMFIALFQGDVKAIVAEEPEVIGTLNRLGLSGAVQKGEKLFQNDIYAGVLKENKELMELVNRGINAIPESVRRELQERYFPSKSNWPRIILWFVAFIMILLCSIVLVSLNNKMLNRKIKERTSKLQESEKRLWMILDQAPLGILIIDSRTMLLQYANPSVCQMLRYEKGELRDMDVALLHMPEDFTQVSQKIKELAEGYKNIATDIPFLRKDGTMLDVDINAAPIELDKRPHLAAFLVDRTETRKLGIQLQHAQKMEAIGNLAGGVAHDLNNILSGVVGYPELLLRTLPKDSSLRKPLEAIHDSGQRAATVVADLLTVARGAASIRETHNINVLTEEYLDSPECEKLKSLYPEITFQSQFKAGHPTISCSPIHVKKCLMNLVTNAAEAIGKDGTLIVSTRNESIDDTAGGTQKIEIGAYVVISIQDTGSGISDIDLEHVFEPFYTTKTMGRSGTGLGLAIVWNTVQDHNGKVVVDSNEKGTSFQLYFPVSKNDVIDQIKTDKTEEFSSSGEHILVVDDESQLRDIASQMLQASGYNVDSVCSGELAIEFVKDTPVDLIVMDMMMEPGINGCQAYEEILTLFPDQKAIITSGFSESDDVKEALALGAGGFIKKPYSMAKLDRAVKEALNAP